MCQAFWIICLSVMFVTLMPPPGPGPMNMRRSSGAAGLIDAISNSLGARASPDYKDRCKLSADDHGLPRGNHFIEFLT
jgi:hypothetical protein